MWDFDQCPTPDGVCPCSQVGENSTCSLKWYYLFSYFWNITISLCCRCKSNLIPHCNRNLSVTYFYFAVITSEPVQSCFCLPSTSFSIYFCMTGILMKLAQSLQCNLLFLLLCQYCALRSSIVFNERKKNSLNHAMPKRKQETANACALIHLPRLRPLKQSLAN